MVGFSPTSYTVSEAAGTVTLTVRIISGTLQTQVSTVFSTSPDTAVGKLVDNMYKSCLSQIAASYWSLYDLSPPTKLVRTTQL